MPIDPQIQGVDFSQFPLFLAPMAGVTNRIFRSLCKQFGVDVLTTEFVSSEGVFRRNARTLEYLEFDEGERPLGVQLFGAEPAHMGEAARIIMDWKRPDFIDLNFGCPVNKVVAKNGGSALLRDCPLLERVAREVVKAVAPFPVTAKIRIGWDQASINALLVARILEEAGIRVLTVHGRTKDQGYGGEADWETIAQVAGAVSIPVIGNGDITCAQEVKSRREQSGVAGVMIGRSAMSSPWIFREIKEYLATGRLLPEPSLEEQWAFIRNHCQLVIAAEGSEYHAMASMRSRLMAYSRGMPEAKHLRNSFAKVTTLAELDRIAAENQRSHRGERSSGQGPLGG